MGGDVVPLWKSDTNGGSYTTNDIVNYNGVLYKSLTGVNTDIDPTLETTNWESLKGLIAGTATNNTLRWDGTNWVESTALQNDGTDIATTGNLETDTFSTNWKSNTNGGAYAINDIVIYLGSFYKNITGTNTDTSPNSNVVDWETLKTPASPNYLQAEVTTVGVGAGTHLEFSVQESFGMEYTLTAVSLKKGTTYLLRSSLSGYFSVSTSNELRTQWETANGTRLGNASRQMPGSNYQKYSESPEASVVYTPTVDTTVHLEVITETFDFTGQGTIFGYLQVIELSRGGGTGFAIYHVNNDYKIGDTMVEDGKIYQANGNIAAGTVFAEGTTGATWTALTTHAVGGGDTGVPFWKSLTNGGSYVTNDIINYGGKLYKNKSGLNSNSSPVSDTGRWEKIIQDPEVTIQKLRIRDTNPGDNYIDTALGIPSNNRFDMVLAGNTNLYISCLSGSLRINASFDGSKVGLSYSSSNWKSLGRLSGSEYNQVFFDLLTSDGYMYKFEMSSMGDGYVYIIVKYWDSF